MDELEKKPDAPLTPEEPEKQEAQPDPRGFDNRRKLMFLLCGGYLLYLACKMARDYPALAAAGVWNTDRIVVLCGMIAFGIIGVGMLGFTAYKTIREWKQTAQKQNDANGDDSHVE